MQTPVFCTDNLFDDLLYTGHTVTANEEAGGKEVWHVANNRRSPSDYWTPTTANNAAWVRVDCGAAKAADFIAIDRGSNLEGKTITLATSPDNVTYTTVFSVAVPSAAVDDTALAAAAGAYTEEGAWVKSFTSASARYWRLTVSAAVSYTPRIVGLWLGARWDVGTYHDRPHDEDASVGAWTAEQNELGWSAYSTDADVRQGEVSLRLMSDAAYDSAARSFLAQYRKGRPAWYVPDTDRAERAFLLKCPQGARVGAPYETGWGYRTVRLPYVEHQPVVS